MGKRVTGAIMRDYGLACLNGHAINPRARSCPEYNTKFCATCGEPTIDACPKCRESILGPVFYDYEPIQVERWKPPAFCHQCGAPYPWTERRKESLAVAIDELDELEEVERNNLKESIPDVIQETPKTETAAARFKKAIANAGSIGGKLLTEVLTKVAAEVVVKSVGIK